MHLQSMERCESKTNVSTEAEDCREGNLTLAEKHYFAVLFKMPSTPQTK